jgi:peptidoglycan/LPS O-acetylase OafA/YrhL
MIKKNSLKAFALICIVSYFWIYISQFLYSPEAKVYLLQNAPGHLPEFAFGILLALNPGKRIHFVWVVFSFVIFSLGNFYKPFFPLTFLSITVFMYWVLSKTIPLILNKTKILKPTIIFYGSISMVLFVIHGELRGRFLSIQGETFLTRYFSAILFIIASTALAILGVMMYNWMIKQSKKL